MTDGMRRAMEDRKQAASDRAAAAREAAGNARQSAGERVETAKARAGERMETAKVAAGERVDSAKLVAEQRTAAAKEVAGERMEAARLVAEELREKVKPRLRGVFHKWAFFVSLVAGIALILTASGGEARLAAVIYAFSLSALLGTSAVYHRVDWKRPSSRRWMRRLDHSMIFVLIAGTLTPFALLVMDGPFATGLLIAAWAAALAGIIVELIWVEAPKWFSVLVYVSVGWIGALGFPSIAVEAGLGAGLLIAAGGVMYTAGGIIYARQSPDPNPAVFGYHEIFHVLVVVAAAAHFAAVAIYALPAA